MVDKKGGVDWTVGKLMTIVLAVVVVVLVVFGITTGGLNPLIERMGGAMDEARLLLSFLDWNGGHGASGDCDFLDVSESFGKGKLERCQDYCEMVLEKPMDYSKVDKLRLRNEDGEDVFEIVEGENSVPINYHLMDVEGAERYRAAYLGLKKADSDIFDYGFYKNYRDAFYATERDSLYFSLDDSSLNDIVKVAKFVFDEKKSKWSYYVYEDEKWVLSEMVSGEIYDYIFEVYNRGLGMVWGYEFYEDDSLLEKFPESSEMRIDEKTGRDYYEGVKGGKRLSLGFWLQVKKTEIETGLSSKETLEEISGLIDRSTKVNFLDKDYDVKVKVSPDRRRVIYFEKGKDGYGFMISSGESVLVDSNSFKVIPKGEFYYDVSDEEFKDVETMNSIYVYMEEKC
ncbi:MAG: hypothetical protein KJ592_00575 [Nanoarchaeota archaeon]|nr:hypothetical protein [Nanoarchaeota archaeon]